MPPYKPPLPRTQKYMMIELESTELYEKSHQNLKCMLYEFLFIFRKISLKRNGIFLLIFSQEVTYGSSDIFQFVHARARTLSQNSATNAANVNKLWRPNPL